MSLNDPASLLPTIVGHRGVTETAPENTLIALKHAAEASLTWVEFDVQLTRDAVPVVFHDSELERTSDGSGRLCDATFDELSDIDVGSWFSPQFAGERLASFRQAVERCVALGLSMNVEIKPGLGDPEETTAQAQSVLRSVGMSDTGQIGASQVLFSSFEMPSLMAAKQGTPDVPRGLLLHGMPDDWLDLAKQCAATTIHTWHEPLTKAQVADIHQAGYPLMVYSIDRIPDLTRAIDLGVRSFCSGDPNRLRPHLPRL